MKDNVNVRMMKSPGRDLVTVVIRHEDTKPLSNQDIVDALCEYLMIFNSHVQMESREITKRTKIS